ncbi:hypothetical protein F5887DRAFT_1282754 [Amanita rubescens]|nr:hypothetical protein F5887DRAFT_1282754 [Amanita rubescens]
MGHARANFKSKCRRLYHLKRAHGHPESPAGDLLMARASRKKQTAGTIPPSDNAQQQDGVSKRTRKGTGKDKENSATTPSDATQQLGSGDVSMAAPQPSNDGAIVAQSQGTAHQAVVPEAPSGSDNGREERVMQLLAENQKLRSINRDLIMSSESAKTRKMIDKPAGQGWNLQEMMELKDNKILYNAIRRTVRQLVLRSPMDLNILWKNQDAQIVADIMALAKKSHPYLICFPRNWATSEMIRLVLKNQRSTQRNRQQQVEANDEGSNGDDAH